LPSWQPAKAAAIAIAAIHRCIANPVMLCSSALMIMRVFPPFGGVSTALWGDYGGM